MTTPDASRDDVIPVPRSLLMRLIYLASATEGAYWRDNFQHLPYDDRAEASMTGITDDDIAVIEQAGALLDAPDDASRDDLVTGNEPRTCVVCGTTSDATYRATNGMWYCYSESPWTNPNASAPSGDASRDERGETSG